MKKNNELITDNRIDIRNCVFGFKCEVNWDEMALTNDDKVRHCDTCQKNVYLVDDRDELFEAIKLNRCVAIINDEVTLIHRSSGHIVGYIGDK